MKRALVTYSIEQSLIDIGGDRLLGRVSDLLNESYGIGISECYANPQYLHDILFEMYGNCSKEIVKSINSKLEEFEDQEIVSNFLKAIKTN